LEVQIKIVAFYLTGVVSATAFVPTAASMIVMLLIHKFLFSFSFSGKWLDDAVKGKEVLLY
jgi:hypothetical protein